MKWLGVVDGREDYSIAQKCHLVRSVGEWGGNLYIWNQFAWESSYRSIPSEDLSALARLASAASNAGMALWVGVKPGDHSDCMHAQDRELFRSNARTLLAHGADGIYVPMDDTHPGGKIASTDGEYQGRLISELADDLGAGFKGICGEEYHGAGFNRMDYWQPILHALPEHALVTWTGPRIWNRTLTGSDIPELDRPLLLWDNYFASDNSSIERAPTYPLDGRDASLLDSVDGYVVHPNLHYPWQYCALRTTFRFLADPGRYAPEMAFKEAILELGDNWWSAYLATCPTVIDD